MIFYPKKGTAICRSSAKTSKFMLSDSIFCKLHSCENIFAKLLVF